jgi:cytochrome P450
MAAPASPQRLDSIPITELATCPDPAGWHEELRSLGTHTRADCWIVSTPLDVAEALAAPALQVVPPPVAVGPAADLIAGMARFSDGPAHQRRRVLTLRLLPAVGEVASLAAASAARHVRMAAAADVLDVMPLARALPAEVLARAMGLSTGAAATAADWTGRLCEALHSGRASAADEAAIRLSAALRPLPLSSEDEVAAAASILFQARDATAALIGAAVLASVPCQSSPTSVLVDSALRRAAPVQCTRRAAAADTTIGAALIPRGSDVWIFLAAAELGNGTPATFGSGPHGCPGAQAASAIAREVVMALDAGGWRPVAGQAIDYERRPNLRLPRRVLVSRG